MTCCQNEWIAAPLVGASLMPLPLCLDPVLIRVASQLVLRKFARATIGILFSLKSGKANGENEARLIVAQFDASIMQIGDSIDETETKTGAGLCPALV